MHKRAFTVRGTAYKPHERVMVIAEIGTGHNGSLARAKELIDAARLSGADAAKFQIVYADEILHPDTGFVTLPGGKIRLYDRFRELEVNPEFYAEAASYARKCGIGFLASPFGLKSLAELDALDPDCVKIASPELNHFPLLEAAARLKRPVILSSGVSTLGDIERALEITRSCPEVALLHCVTSYPAPETDYNVNVLDSISSAFGVPVGLSDHSLDPVLVPLLAVAAGAVIVEKHICLSKSDPGLDDPVALPPEDFARMTDAIKGALNAGPDADGVRSGVIERLAAEHGRETVERILGDGVKRLAPSERENYARTNRSLHYLGDLRSGSVVTEGDVAILRTEKVLTPGLSPDALDTIVGARLARDVRSGAGVSWEDFFSRPSPR
jgi:sialic acid synthase SpsE